MNPAPQSTSRRGTAGRTSARRTSTSSSCTRPRRRRRRRARRTERPWDSLAPLRPAAGSSRPGIGEADHAGRAVSVRVARPPAPHSLMICGSQIGMSHSSPCAHLRDGRAGGCAHRLAGEPFAAVGVAPTRHALGVRGTRSAEGSRAETSVATVRRMNRGRDHRRLLGGRGDDGGRRGRRPSECTQSASSRTRRSPAGSPLVAVSSCAI